MGNIQTDDMGNTILVSFMSVVAAVAVSPEGTAKISPAR
jgi:hypothetical protein